MPNYVHHCPHCRADQTDISWSAAYFDIYECSECAEKYCCKCRDSNNGKQCPECGNADYHRAVARVSKN